MATITDKRSINATLSTTTVDRAQLLQFWDYIEVYNGEASGGDMVYITDDGATDPVAAAEGTMSVAPGERLVFKARPLTNSIPNGSSVICHEIRVLGNGGLYSVLGANHTGTQAGTTVDAATDSARGTVELATTAEVQTGTSTTLVPSVASMVAGGGQVLIAESVLSVAAVSFDFTSIPSTFRHLRLEVVLRSDRAGQTNDAVVLTFNNDTTDANYDRQLIHAGSSTLTGEQALATSGSRSICEAPAANTTANVFTSGVIEVPHYGQTSAFKVATAVVPSLRVRSSGQMRWQSNMVMWASTSAITRITLTPGAGTNFIAGSRVALYGIG